jgi:hypothetical protein
MEIRYESLLERPKETMRAVCEFLEEPFTDAVLRPAPRTWVYSADVRARGTFRQRTEIERSNQGKWRDRMPIADRTVVESVAGDLLDELGYELEGLARPILRASRAWWRTEDAVRSSLSRVFNRQLSLRNGALALRAELRGRLRPEL